MRRSGRHVERRRHHDQPRALERQNAKELSKAHVEADCHAEFSERRVHERVLLPGRERIGLEKALAARHVDIEQVHLAVLRLLRPLRVKHVAGIVDRVPVAFRHGACDEPDAACARRVAQQTPRLAALRLGVLHKRRIVIWAAPHLRQHDQITAGRSGIAHIAAHDRIILRFGRRDRHLAQAKFHDIPASTCMMHPA